VLQAGFSVAHSPRREVLCRNAQFLGWQRSESEEPAERALCWAFSICNGSQGLLPRLSKTRFLMSIYELPSSQHQVNLFPLHPMSKGLPAGPGVPPKKHCGPSK
jgi:hypothetical protein